MYGIRRASLVAQTKESACKARDLDLIPMSGRAPGEGNGNPVFLPGESHGQMVLESILVSFFYM